MGWNTITVRRSHPVLWGLEEGSRFYFVHSYHVVCHDPELVLASTSYGVEFVSAVARDNIVGVQFHPEKSHRFGMQLYRNFVHAHP
jgi:glutamine amidotransferase